MGLRSRKEKNIDNSIIFRSKIKVRSNFIWKKLMELLLLNELLKNLFFFQWPLKKVAFMTLILSKFQSLNANLWSIYSKRFEFMVYTFICKIKFFRLLRPSTSSGALKKVLKYSSHQISSHPYRCSIFLSLWCLKNDGKAKNVKLT